MEISKIERIMDNMKLARNCLRESGEILYRGEEITTEDELDEAIKNNILEKIQDMNELVTKRSVQVWDLKNDYAKLKNELESTNTQMDLLKDENDRLKQIIKILDAGYSHFNMSGKFALDFSEEAHTMSYHDMQVLQILLERVIAD